MTVIPFPRRVLAPKAVADFKRVCDAEKLELRDDEVSATLDQLQAALDPNPPEPEPPPRDDV